MNNTNYIYHHGIKGMRWGVRRYQNSDGSLTAAGRKRYAEDRAALIKDAERINKKSGSYGRVGMTIGKLQQRDFWSNKTYVSHHILDKMGKVKLSYFESEAGSIYLASGKKWIEENLNLSDYFYNTKKMNIEYDVYD